MALPLDFSVAASFLVAFFLKVFLAILNRVAFLVTLAVGVAAGAVDAFWVTYNVASILLLEYSEVVMNVQLFSHHLTCRQCFEGFFVN